MNLIEGLQAEIARVREIAAVYDTLPRRSGELTAALMRDNIAAAEKAMAHGDTIEMMRQLQKLREWEL
jgi:hypothetical protein